MKEIVRELPEYDYIYLGDNARAPYGTRSFETVYRYTWECVQWFFEQGSELVILACNTASAKALRTIQQQHLKGKYGDKRVLGVIRPTAEVVGELTQSGNIGILATSGTVDSGSYPIEIQKFFPDLGVYQEACPMWVPLVENNETSGPGVDYFVKKHLQNLLDQQPEIDTLLLACTHYPLLMDAIQKNLGQQAVKVIAQGEIVAGSLADYLHRHPEIESRCSRNGQRAFYTTDSTEGFDQKAALFYGCPLKSKHVDLSLHSFPVSD